MPIFAVLRLLIPTTTCVPSQLPFSCWSPLTLLLYFISRWPYTPHYHHLSPTPACHSFWSPVTFSRGWWTTQMIPTVVTPTRSPRSTHWLFHSHYYDVTFRYRPTHRPNIPFPSRRCLLFSVVIHFPGAWLFHHLFAGCINLITAWHFYYIQGDFLLRRCVDVKIDSVDVVLRYYVWLHLKFAINCSFCCHLPMTDHIPLHSLRNAFEPTLWRTLFTFAFTFTILRFDLLLRLVFVVAIYTRFVAFSHTLGYVYVTPRWLPMDSGVPVLPTLFPAHFTMTFNSSTFCAFTFGELLHSPFADLPLTYRDHHTRYGLVTVTPFSARSSRHLVYIPASIVSLFCVNSGSYWRNTWVAYARLAAEFHCTLLRMVAGRIPRCLLRYVTIRYWWWFGLTGTPTVRRVPVTVVYTSSHQFYGSGRRTYAGHYPLFATTRYGIAPRFLFTDFPPRERYGLLPHTTLRLLRWFTRPFQIHYSCGWLLRFSVRLPHIVAFGSPVQHSRYWIAC